MHPALKKFFVDLQKWIEAGTPDDRVFSRYAGLCSNCEHYFKHRTSYSKELQRMFKRRKRPVIPFNAAMIEYTQEVEHGTVWNNRKRLAFVKRHAEDVCHQS